jgi:putative transposase
MEDLIEITELNVQADHIHLVMSVASKNLKSGLMGNLNGKLALWLFEEYKKIRKRYWGRRLW